MQIINGFKRKGGRVLWIEGLGSQASYVGEPIKMLIDMKTRDVFRCTVQEWDSPPENLTRCKVFFG
jgi:hypothetical protein